MFGDKPLIARVRPGTDAESKLKLGDEVVHMFALARKYPALIFDLRDNPGGRILTLERVVANVFDHDVKIADRIGRKELKRQLARTRGAAAYTGRVIVLVDSSSASAVDLATGLDPALARAAQIAGVKLSAAAAGKMFPFEWLKL